MARPLRIEYEEVVHPITSRGDAGENIFPNDEYRRAFLVTFEETVTRYERIGHAVA